MINNRQNGRRRGRGGGGQRSPGGGQGQRDSGNRIDSRARGNASQLYEKYKNMASDAQRSGDRVQTEYYLQFADHYYRVLADQRGRYEEQGQPRRQGDFAAGDFDGDEEYGDEGESIRADEQRRDEGERAAGGQRDRAPRENGRENGREHGHRQDGGREQRHEARRERGSRDDQRNADADPREERAAPVAVNDADEPVTAASDEAAAPPRRRGRPRKQPVDAGDAGFDASVLPPALGTAGETPAAGEGDDAAAPRPRRRRLVSAAPATTQAG